jgi:hypothetical protein
MTPAQLDRGNDIKDEMRGIEYSIKELDSVDDGTFPIKDYNKSEISFCFGTWNTKIELRKVQAKDYIFIKSYMLAMYRVRLTDLQKEFDNL